MVRSEFLFLISFIFLVREGGSGIVDMTFCVQFLNIRGITAQYVPSDTAIRHSLVFLAISYYPNPHRELHSPICRLYHIFKFTGTSLS